MPVPGDGGIDVLHVEDDPDLAALTAEYLQREDAVFEVEHASDAAAGLEELADRPVDCIVSDYDMPGRDGIEFLEAVRDRRPDLPFILYTGKGSEEVASDAISAGVTDYLQKKGGSDQYTILANRIKNAVAGHRSRQQLDERNRELRVYERIFNTLHEGACLYDEAGRFVVVNEYLAGFYDGPRESLEGKKSPLIDHIRTTEDCDPYDELLRGERSHLQGEVAGTFGDHGYAVLEYRLSPLQADDRHDGVVGVVRVVTDDKERRRQLRRTNMVLQAVLDNHTDGVLAETADREVLLANDALGELLGVSVDPDELIGRDCGAASADLKDAFADPAAFVAGIDDHVERREPVCGERLELADGRVLERDFVPYSLPNGPANLWIYRAAYAELPPDSG